MASTPYDWKFTVGANTYGFMLVSPEGMSKQMVVTEVGGPDAARVTDSAGATHQDYDPKYDTPFSQDNFASGVGQLHFDGADVNSVWWAPGVVLHTDGKAYLAPPASSLSLTSGTTQINGFTTYTTSAGARYDFCWAGRRIYRRDAANITNAWSVAFTHANSFDVTDFKVFNGVGLIAVPTETSASIDYVYVTGNLTSGTFTTSNANHTPFSSGVKPKYFEPVRGTVYAIVDNAKVYYTVDPTTDGWVGPISVTVGAGSAPNVGDSSFAFTNSAAVQDYLFAFKADGGYNIDAEQNVSEIFYQWKDKPSMSNFKHVAVGKDSLLLAVGPEVYVYDPGTGATAEMGLSKQSGFSVQEVLGLGADNQYVYILAQVMVQGINTATSVALIRAFKRRGARYGFEVLWEDTSVTETYYSLAAVPFGLGTRLYWGYISSGATSTMVMDIPAEWDESAKTSYAASGVMYTSITRGFFPGFTKRHLWLSYETQGTTNSSHKVAAAYSLDNGASWTSLGDTGSGAAGTVITRLEYTAISSRSFALRFTFTSGGTSTPVLRVYDHHQRVRFRYLPSVSGSVRVADKIAMNNGAIDTRSKAQIRADIDTLRTTDSAILYEDFLGNSFTCTVDAISYSPTRHYIPNMTTNVYELEAMLVVSRADAGA